MTKRLKKKSAVLVAAIAASMVVMGLLLNGMQEHLQLANCDFEIQDEADELPELLSAAADETAQNTETFDAIYQSKADSVAFMAKNDVGFEGTDAKMAEYRELLDVDNIMVVARDGRIAAQAAPTKADFTSEQFAALRAVADGAEAAEPVEVDAPDQAWLARYYACALPDGTAVVIEQSPAQLRDLVQATGSVASVLKDMTVGTNGYVLAISDSDYQVTYAPDAARVGTSALDGGFNEADLAEGNFFHTVFAGEALYCGAFHIDGAYYVYCVPERDLLSARVLTVGVLLFVFLAVMVAVALYGVFVLREDERTGAAEKFAAFGPYRYNQAVGKKAMVLSVVGFLVIVGVAFYMQSLFALSSQAVTNNQRACEISESLADNTKRADALEDVYAQRYLNKCHVAAYMIEQNPALASHDKLVEMAQVLQIAYVYTFDGDGVMTASNTSQRSYSLSTTYGDSSYEFRSLLSGKDEFLQEPSVNASTGEVNQWLGVALYDADGIANGLVQIGVRTSSLATLMKSLQIDHVLDGVKVGSEGFAFAVNKSDGTIAYYPNEKLIGKGAEDVGLTKSQMKDGFSDYLTIDGEKYFARCAELSDCYLFVAGPEGELMAQRVPLSVTTGVVALACLAFVFVVLSLELTDEAADQAAARQMSRRQLRGSDSGRMVDVTMADGRTKRTESAMSRWLTRSLAWGDKSPEQKLATVIRWFAGVAVFAVFLAVMAGDSVFAENSVFAYILGGGWERGLNIFAVTASVMYACVAITVAAVVQWVLRLLSDALGTRGETVCRLLSSIVKYGTVIAMLYWCLGVLGVDTATLLASLGIITLALSFGAKDLITDILSGLFIIFEGEFRVGDIIQVGGNTGTVMEIGVRTTKIKNGAGDVLVLRNSGISNVVNKTKLDSYATVDVVIPTGESLPYVENVLATELPRVRERVPEILDGPFYKGVVELTDAAMTVRVVATCAEGDRAGLERSLKREMKLLLSRNDIAPYQLTVEHGEAERRAADERFAGTREMRDADRFSEQQATAARNVGNDEGAK